MKVLEMPNPFYCTCQLFDGNKTGLNLEANIDHVGEIFTSSKSHSNAYATQTTTEKHILVR